MKDINLQEDGTYEHLVCTYYGYLGIVLGFDFDSCTQ
jgi:hypothetical protein